LYPKVTTVTSMPGRCPGRCRAVQRPGGGRGPCNLSYPVIWSARHRTSVRSSRSCRIASSRVADPLPAYGACGSRCTAGPAPGPPPRETASRCSPPPFSAHGTGRGTHRRIPVRGCLSDGGPRRPVGPRENARKSFKSGSAGCQHRSSRGPSNALSAALLPEPDIPVTTMVRLRFIVRASDGASGSGRAPRRFPVP